MPRSKGLRGDLGSPARGPRAVRHRLGGRSRRYAGTLRFDYRLPTELAWRVRAMWRYQKVRQPAMHAARPRQPPGIPRAALVACHRQSQSTAPKAVAAGQNHTGMAAVKVTLSLSPETVELLSDAATRLGIPKSQVVRDAIEESHAGICRLSWAEQVRMLAVLDEFAATPATRSDDDVQPELVEIRETRHGDTGRARFE